MQVIKQARRLHLSSYNIMVLSVNLRNVVPSRKYCSSKIGSTLLERLTYYHHALLYERVTSLTQTVGTHIIEHLTQTYKVFIITNVIGQSRNKCFLYHVWFGLVIGDGQLYDHFH